MAAQFHTLMFMQNLIHLNHLNVWLRLCLLPAGCSPTTLYRLDVLHKPSEPCMKGVLTSVQVYDTAGGSMEKIGCGDYHNFLSFVLSTSRRYTVLTSTGFCWDIQWITNPQLALSVVSGEE